jgi:hypothetical protein
MPLLLVLASALYSCSRMKRCKVIYWAGILVRFVFLLPIITANSRAVAGRAQDSHGAGEIGAGAYARVRHHRHRLWMAHSVFTSLLLPPGSLTPPTVLHLAFGLGSGVLLDDIFSHVAYCASITSASC